MEQVAKETLPVSLEEEMRRSYLDYAMSVIVGRALPDVRDGLKPVHRRILFAMHEANNVWNRPYVKCARVVGDVLGKYHPHGDTATYEALVRMAQDFSMRYTLIDGQGNFGSIDGDSAAAYRYTECRLEKITSEMLADIDMETVDFVPNYDGKEREPVTLPTRIPNLLVNGSSGIAVGMATNIPPHNLGEVIDACQALLKNPQLSIDELIEIIPAPDFPTRGVIYGVAGVREGYRTGPRPHRHARAHAFRGSPTRAGGPRSSSTSCRTRSTRRISSCASASSCARSVSKGISDIRDESDKRGMRAVIELKRGEVPDIILNRLWKETQLQDTFGMNIVALVDGQPRLLNLKQFLEAFLRHRREVVTRRTVFELRKARERGHVLEGLAVALSNVDEVIALIKAAASPAEAKSQLMARTWRSHARGGHARAKREPAVTARRHLARVRLAPGRLQAVGRAGAAHPGNAASEPDRPRAGQDRHGVSRDDGQDLRSPRYPLQSRTGDTHHFGRARRNEETVRRRAAQRDRDDDAGSRHGGFHHARGRRRDTLSQRLHEIPAGRRLSGAEARRPRAAGDDDQGRRFRRKGIHRQHARLHPVFLEPRAVCTG